MEKAYKFNTLLGRKNLDFSIECLNSFLENSKDKIELQIFDDGTITVADRDKILSALMNTSVITKAEREEIVKQKLLPYPNCMKYRESTVYAHKLFDVILYNETDILFIDSDVYFLKRFQLPLFENPVFMRDTQNAYSFRPAEFISIRYPIFPRVNSGLFFFPFRFFDLAFVERLLSDTVIAKGFNRISWLEQTLWAFLAGKAGSIQYFDPDEIKMSRQNLFLAENTVAVHLVSSFRHHFDFLKAISAGNPEDKSITELRLLNTSAYLNKYSFTVDRIRKGIYRRMGVFQ